MFSTFSSWINNALIQSLILSPLMGVIFGALFSSLSLSPSATNTVIVRETRQEFKERIIYCNKEVNSSNGNSFFSVIICLTVLIIFLSWQYIFYYEVILSLLFNFIITIVPFACTVFAISFFKGHFTDKSWWISVLYPLFTLCSSFYLLHLAMNAVDLELTEIARRGSATDFYLDGLTTYGWHYVISQFFGIILLATLICINALATLHYLALMNQRGNGNFQKFWELITSFTWKFGSKNVQIASFFLWICSFLLIEGHVATWTNKF